MKLLVVKSKGLLVEGWVIGSRRTLEARLVLLALSERLPIRRSGASSDPDFFKLFANSKSGLLYFEPSVRDDDCGASVRKDDMPDNSEFGRSCTVDSPAVEPGDKREGWKLLLCEERLDKKLVEVC